MDSNWPNGGLCFLHDLKSPPIVMGGLAVIGLSCLAPQPLLAAGGERWLEWSQELRGNLWDPWFLFGMGAQTVFFLRFAVQWVVSERRKRSTIPVAFWYLSLVGGLATFVYACHEAQPVFMLGQLLACMIYVRNLMLIYAHADRVRKRSKRPIGELEPEFGDENSGQGGSSG